MKSKTGPVEDIFVFPRPNSGLTKREVSLEKESNDLIPVYSASKDKDYVFGYVEKTSKWKSYKNVLSWNADGLYAGCVFYHEDEFVPYEKIKLMKLKPEYEKNLDYKFLRKTIELELLSMSFGFRYKCAIKRVKKISIKIPIDDNDNFDLDSQKAIAEKYKSLEEIADELKSLYDDFKKVKFDLGIDFNFREFPIVDIFHIEKGKSKYARRYIKDNLGEFPIYSSQTKDEGVIGKIDTYDYDVECLTWTTDGAYAGTVFYRNGKFSMTSHCGALIPKENYRNKIDLRFISQYLNNYLKDYAVGEGNKRVTIKIMEKVSIKIPMYKTGKIDLPKQKEYRGKYEKLEQVKRDLIIDIQDTLDSQVLI